MYLSTNFRFATTFNFIFQYHKKKRKMERNTAKVIPNSIKIKNKNNKQGGVLIAMHIKKYHVSALEHKH